MCPAAGGAAVVGRRHTWVPPCGFFFDENRHPVLSTGKAAVASACYLQREVAGMEDYWNLFFETGAPEFYVLYRSCKEEDEWQSSK